MIVGRKIEGLVLARIMFEGTSKKTYVMKNTTNAMEYWSELMLRSSVMPATFAFPMLVLWIDNQLCGPKYTSLDLGDERPCSSRGT